MRTLGRLGYRGRALLALSFLFGSYGAGLTLVALGIDGPAVATVRLIGQAVPAVALAAVWLLASLACAVYAFRRRDALGWAVASCVLVAWTVVSLVAWLFDGAPRGYLGVAIWGSFATLVMTLSGWPEAGSLPHRRTRTVPPESPQE